MVAHIVRVFLRIVATTVDGGHVVAVCRCGNQGVSMTFTNRIAALAADGFTFAPTVKRRGSPLRLAFGSHPCGVGVEVHETTTGPAYYRVSA